MSEAATPTAWGSDTIRVPEVETPTYASLTVRAAVLRDRADAIQTDARNLPRETLVGAVDERTALVALQEPAQLLEALSDRYGLSWASIARMVSVTDAAIRKWRRGETIGPQNRHRLARTLAFLEILNSFPVGDVATWLEMRLSEEATISPIDLYVEGRADLLLDFVSRRASTYEVLDAFDSNWRSTYPVDSRFKVTIAADGGPAIVEQ